MKNSLIITQGKALSSLSKKINLGNGTTWPGHIALSLNSSFIKDILGHNPQLQIIFVVGTNGKTTTTSLIKHILEKNDRKVIQNNSGANMLNGIASAILLNASLSKKIDADILLLELDESSFPQACKEMTPNFIVALNLFRDQLDRFGEVNTIAQKWHEALRLLPDSTHLILNADDPQIAYLGKKSKLNETYFGIDEKAGKKISIDHSSDSTYCPNCAEKLTYTKIFYSHLGVWSCSNCQLVRPSHVTTSSPLYPLEGTYNKYNANAATTISRLLGLTDEQISLGLKTFSPSFGRQEKITFGEKQVEIILAKNPAGFDQALLTVLEKKSTNILFALNDNAADGTDISWIWDVDFEMLLDQKINITLTGTRAYELALRLKYAQNKVQNSLPANATHQALQAGEFRIQSESDIEKAIQIALKHLPAGQILYILSTYTAMLQIRKVLTGKKIL